jgi:hypothetical protein
MLPPFASWDRIPSILDKPVPVRLQNAGQAGWVARIARWRAKTEPAANTP